MLHSRMAGIRDQAMALLNEVKAKSEASMKVDLLKSLVDLVLHRDPSSLLPEFVPHLMELQTEPGSPVRKYLAEMIESIGVQHVYFVPIMIPVLLALLQDTTPAVARRAVTSGSNIFRTVLEQVKSQAVDNGQVERRLLDCWNWMICFKDAVYSLAFQHGNDGVRLLALKFVETTALLGTPDPNGSLPNQQSSDERSPRITSRVAASITGQGSLSRSHSSLGRSPPGSERFSFSAVSPRSERSVMSVPETVLSSAEQGYGRGSLKSASRTTSLSSLAEWSGGSLDRRGELSIAALSLGEGRNISELSGRTEVTSMRSPALLETQALDYSPDTDSGMGIFHETTSASPGSYSRRSSCSLSEERISEVEDPDGVSHQCRRSKYRSDHHSRSFSHSSHSRSQSGSARHSPSSSLRNRDQYSPNTLRKFRKKQNSPDSPSGKVRYHGDYYDRRRNVNSSVANLSRSQKRRDNAQSAAANSKVVVLLGKYGRKKGNHGVGTQPDDLDDMVTLDSMTPQEAIAVFHDEVARMMHEEGEECVEADDVQEFLDGYMRLRSPFYLAMVEEFFRSLCVDCYKRPVEISFDGRSGSFSTSSKSLRSDSITSVTSR